MSGQRYTPEFKDEAVKLITERGYSVTSKLKYFKKWSRLVKFILGKLLYT